MNLPKIYVFIIVVLFVSICIGKLFVDLFKQYIFKCYFFIENSNCFHLKLNTENDVQFELQTTMVIYSLSFLKSNLIF